MNSAIITVGDELLNGSVCNTNVQWLGDRLFKLGFPVREAISLPDNEAVLTRKLRQLSNEYSLIIVSGGLGPTSDDLTREAAAEAFYCPLELCSEVVENIRRFFSRLDRDMPASNRKQAMIPKGAKILPNEKGTAPGFLITRGEKYIVFLPGVPLEMKHIFTETITPWLNSLTESISGRDITLSRTFNVCFIGESALEDRIGHLATVSTNPALSYLCSPGVISLTIKASSPSKAESTTMLDTLEEQIRREVGPLIKGRADEKLVHSVLRVLQEKKRYVYIRDKATGGLLGATICNAIGTDTDWSNSLFAGSLVLGTSFTNDAVKGYELLVAEAKSEMAQNPQRVELVVAPLEKDNGSTVRCFVGIGDDSREVTLKTIPGTNNAARLVNGSLASLYDVLNAL